jgi:hypothetical protein
MLLNTNYTFYETHTLLEVEGMRLVYLLPENITALRDEVYDHAFVLFKPNVKPLVEWRRIKNEDRRTIHLKNVRRPSSYMLGCALLFPTSVPLERDEILVRYDDHIARLFSYSSRGKRFVPHHLKDMVIVGKEEEKLAPTLLHQPLIDVSVMSCPCVDKEKQMAFL